MAAEGFATAIVVEAVQVQVDVPAKSVAEADPTVAFVAAEMATEHSKKHPKMTPATAHFAAAATDPFVALRRDVER